MTSRQRLRMNGYHLNTHLRPPSHPLPKSLVKAPPSFIKLQAPNSIKIKSMLSVKPKKGSVSQFPHSEETLLGTLGKAFNQN